MFHSASLGDASLGLIYGFLCLAALFTPAAFDALKTRISGTSILPAETTDPASTLQGETP